MKVKVVSDTSGIGDRGDIVEVADELVRPMERAGDVKRVKSKARKRTRKASK